MPELLDERVIHQSGSFVIRRRWYRGVHPGLGQIIYGFTGWETVQDVESMVATLTVVVKDGAAESLTHQ